MLSDRSNSSSQRMARTSIGGFAGFSPSIVLALSAYATEMGLDFAHHAPVRSGSDPEGRLCGNEVESVVEREAGADRAGRAPGVAAPPQHLEAIILRYRFEPGDRRAGAGG